MKSLFKVFIKVSFWSFWGIYVIIKVANEKAGAALTELHEVPGICIGDETFVVVFCPNRP
jgi:hypothetical protein